MTFKAATAMMTLIFILACTGPKQLETSINNHRTVSLYAEATKENGRWKVEMILPTGTWKVTTAEGQETEIIPGDPRSTLRWKVLSDRWNQRDRPFRFTLSDESGLSIDISVRYPDFLSSGQAFLLQLIGSVASRH